MLTFWIPSKSRSSWQVFQFQGSKANPWEKFIGGGVANNLRNERSVYTSKLPELYIIDEKDLDRRCHDMDVQRFCMLLNREQRGIAPPLADDVDCPSEVSEKKSLLNKNLS